MNMIFVYSVSSLINHVILILFMLTISIAVHVIDELSIYSICRIDAANLPLHLPRSVSAMWIVIFSV